MKTNKNDSDKPTETLTVERFRVALEEWPITPRVLFDLLAKEKLPIEEVKKLEDWEWMKYQNTLADIDRENFLGPALTVDDYEDLPKTLTAERFMAVPKGSRERVRLLKKEWLPWSEVLRLPKEQQEEAKMDRQRAFGSTYGIFGVERLGFYGEEPDWWRKNRQRIEEEERNPSESDRLMYGLDADY